MPISRKTKRQLLDELADANRRNQELEIVVNQVQQLKNKLTNREQRYRAVIETQSELICRVLPDYTISFVNSAYCRFYRKTQSQLIGKNFMQDHVPKKDHPLLENHFAGFNKNCSNRTIEQRANGPDGNIYWMQWVDSAIFDEGDAIVEFQCVGRDITDLKKATEALKASHEKLKKQKLALEQKNIALAELMEQISVEKERIRENVLRNVQEVIFPVIEKIRLERGHFQERYLDLLQRNLMDLTEAFGRKISEGSVNLTPKELEICNMIRNGLTSKEAAELLHISNKTLEAHRHNIRRKLGICNQKVNLSSYLLSAKFGILKAAPSLLGGSIGGSRNSESKRSNIYP
jgi:PAS domain S-box-containing protein